MTLHQVVQAVAAGVAATVGVGIGSNCTKPSFSCLFSFKHFFTLVPGSEVSPGLLVPDLEPVAEGPADADVEEHVALVRGHHHQEHQQDGELQQVRTHLGKHQDGQMLWVTLKLLTSRHSSDSSILIPGGAV